MKRHASRRDSSVHQFRVRVPRAVVERVRGRRITVPLPSLGGEPEAVFQTTLGTMAKGSLHTRNIAVADSRRLAVLEHLSKVYLAAQIGPVTLSQRQVEGLAGETYQLLLDEHGENPGTQREWESFKALTRGCAEGRITGAPPIPIRGRSDDEVMRMALFGNAAGEALTASVDALAVTSETRALEQRVGRLAYWVMQRHGLEVDDETRLALLRRIAVAALDAGRDLKRMAGGDFRPSTTAERFPVFQTKKAVSVTLSDVFERWKAEAKPAPSTLWTWSGVPGSLARHLGRTGADLAISDLTTADIVGWKDALIASGLTPQTVNNRQIKCVNVLLNYAVRNSLARENVAKTVRVSGRGKTGERMRGHTDADVARLLAIAAAETDPARRWLPWLATLTGARIGELAALWGTSVIEKEGVLGLEITESPDGSTLKTEHSRRFVPLHPALVETGFVQFARDRGRAPLFYKRRTKDLRHPAKRTSNALSAWVRAQGFDYDRVSPVHGLRHWWKTKAARIGIQDSVADHLQGHAPKGVAALYRDLEDPTFLAGEVARIPVPTLPKEEPDRPLEVEVTHIVEVEQHAGEAAPPRRRTITFVP